MSSHKVWDMGGPVEEESEAQRKLKAMYFSTENKYINGEQNVGSPNKYFYKCTPLIWFCSVGDIEMVRYLLKNGAIGTKENGNGSWFPMLAAAASCHLEICKLLYEHGGAKCDVGKRNTFGDTPVKKAMEVDWVQETSKWLILNGAWSFDDRGDVSLKKMCKTLEWKPDAVTAVKNWVRKVKDDREKFHELFTEDRSCLALLNGKYDAVDHIAGFVGGIVCKPMHVLIIEGLSIHVPALYEYQKKNGRKRAAQGVKKCKFSK